MMFRIREEHTLHLRGQEGEGEGTDQDGEENVHNVTSTRCKKIDERLYARNRRETITFIAVNESGSEVECCNERIRCVAR